MASQVKAWGEGARLNQDDVKLVQEDLLRAEAGLVGGDLDDQVGHIVPDALPLLVVDRAPPVLDDVLQDLHAIRITKCVIGPAGVASKRGC